jgi:hypothetical protein
LLRSPRKSDLLLFVGASGSLAISKGGKEIAYLCSAGLLRAGLNFTKVRKLAGSGFTAKVTIEKLSKS